MKKKYIILFLMISIFSAVSAQESGYKTVTVPFDGERASQAMADISSLDVSFCNEKGSVVYSLIPGDEKKLCYIVSNFSDADVKVNIGFVDGGFTNDQRKNKACQQDGQITNFGQYVTGYESIISLPPRGEIQRFASLQFPENFTGTRNGCLVYSLGGVEMSGKVTFTVLMRKARFIDVNFLEDKKTSVLNHKQLIIGLIILLGIGGFFWIIKKTRRH